MSGVKLTVHRFQSFVPIPSRQTWGECWWTARDICITNEVEVDMPDFAAEIERRLFHEFICGPGGGPGDGS